MDVQARLAMGVVKEDPARGLPAGTKIGAERLHVAFNGPASGSVGNSGDTQGVILAVVFRAGVDEEACTRITGSAVLIAPGIALTATHVVEPELHAILASQQRIVCYGLHPDDRVSIWLPRHLTKVPGTDLTIMSMTYASDPPEQWTFKVASVTTRRPQLGDIITVAGFRAGESMFLGETTPLACEMRIGRGSITDIHPNGRDRVMLPQAAFEIDGHTLGGMSGGAAFDEHGHVIGILTTGFATDDDSGPSNVSMLDFAYCTRFPLAWPEPLNLRRESIISLAGRLVVVEHPEAVACSYDEQTDQVHTHLRSWSYTP